MMKQIIKQILPTWVLKSIKSYRLKKQIKETYLYDMNRYLKNADNIYETREVLIGRIIRKYHVIEKGLTMPDTHLGFGKEVLISLCDTCIQYIKTFEDNEEQLLHAIGVILEYQSFHKVNKYQLDTDIVRKISDLKQLISVPIECSQKTKQKTVYFKDTEACFPLFAASRSSVRNYSSEVVPIEKINNAIEIARSTPSACNRQCWRTYIFTDKCKIEEILVTQGGNRGFGHLTNKLIIVVAEVGVFSGIAERNEAFIDGGMYAMNLLYALHYQKIASCILNCCNNVEKDIKLRILCGIKDSEVFIAMISCGNPPEEFKVANSKRYAVESLNKIIES